MLFAFDEMNGEILEVVEVEVVDRESQLLSEIKETTTIRIDLTRDAWIWSRSLQSQVVE
jgi:hypothetical protein